MKGDVHDTTLCTVRLAIEPDPEPAPVLNP
jgi:hypothetical protein